MTPTVVVVVVVAFLLLLFFVVVVFVAVGVVSAVVVEEGGDDAYGCGTFSWCVIVVIVVVAPLAFEARSVMRGCTMYDVETLEETERVSSDRV